jgi:hypothetical protein
MNNIHRVKILETLGNFKQLWRVLSRGKEEACKPTNQSIYVSTTAVS